MTATMHKPAAKHRTPTIFDPARATLRRDLLGSEGGDEG